MPSIYFQKSQIKSISGRRSFRENDVSEGRCFRETYISATLGNISIAETSFSRKHQSMKTSHVISQKYKSEDQSSWKKMVRGRQTKIFKTFIKTLIKTTRWTFCAGDISVKLEFPWTVVCVKLDFPWLTEIQVSRKLKSLKKFACYI